MTTFGVEEEFLLLDPVSGRPVPRAEEVRAAADLQSALGHEEIQRELLQAQVEIATPVCTDLDEIGGHLLRLRHALGTAAEKTGCRIVASGAAPFEPLGPVPITDSGRYRALRETGRLLVEEQLINGMHVHVAMSDRELGVAVLNRLRPWLPLLAAMSANSPLWQGTDTGFASWRTVVFGRWPVSGPPPRFTGVADYDLRIRDLLACGVVNDLGQLYWQARLSVKYPTVEIRAMDVQLRVDSAVMLAGICRALVSTAVRHEREGLPQPEPRPEVLAAANWYAARHGVSDYLIDPLAAQRRKAGDVISDLMEHIGPALEESGDGREVGSLVHRLLQEGTAADQQRQLLAERGDAAVLQMLTERTTASYEDD